MKPWKHKAGANTTIVQGNHYNRKYFQCTYNEVHFGCSLKRNFRTCTIYKKAKNYLKKRGYL